jgi:DNA repair protein SbcC/Rad50
MRILAIRGKNLASLADEFEILLTEGILQNVGLFAITGHTGAGKSTLLDALCLALYDKMPRLPSGEGIAVGQQHEDPQHYVKHNDVRSILRRGAAHAYAEVDFIGNDKQTYRARWQVSKARGKASGKLQAQEMLLTQINSGQRLGQGKTDTLAAISELIGLNFEQFRRSVLLAQGDFAAFLKAKKDERSSLLERITGTELYSDISIAAFERAKQEKAKLDNLLATLAHQLPLADEARQTLEQRRDLYTAQLHDLALQLAANQDVLNWYAELKKRQAAQQAASDALANCTHAYQAAEPLREQLKKIADAQPLKSLLSHTQHAQTEYDNAKQTLNHIQTLLTAATLKQQQATAQLHSTIEQLNIAEHQYQHAQPQLKTVRALDTRLESLQTELDKLTSEHGQLLNEFNTAQTQHSALSKQLSEQNHTAQLLTDWLAQHQALTLLASDWTHWHSELQRYGLLNQQHDQTTHAITQLQNSLKQTQQRLNALQTDKDAKTQQLAEQKNQLAMLQAREAQLSLSDTLQQKEHLELAQQQLSDALNLAKQTTELTHAIAQTSQRLNDSEQRLETAEQQRNNLSQQQTINQISLIEAKKALALIEATNHKDAEQLRQLLIPDRPCPVCGALQHPWQHATPQGQPHAHAQQQRVTELEDEKATLTSELARCYERWEQEKKLVAELNNQLLYAQQQIDIRHQQWQDLAFDNKPAILDVALLSERHQRVTAELAQLKQQERAALALQQQLKTAQQSLDHSQQQLAQLNHEYDALDKQLLQHNHQQRACEETLEKLEKQLNDLIAALAVPCQALDNWQQYLANPAALTKQVVQFKATEQNLEQLQKDLTAITQQLQLATQQCQYKQQQLTLKQTALQQSNEQRQQLKQQRAALMAEDLTADQIEQNLTQHLNVTRAAHQQANNALHTINSELNQQTHQQHYWQTESTRRAELLQHADHELKLALVKLGISQPELIELLQTDELQLAAQKTQIEQLTNNLQAATTLLTIKTDELKQQQSQPVSDTEPQANETAEQLQQQKQQLTEQKQECELQLRDDDKKIAHSRHIKSELDNQQRRWEQWQSLNELIGSSTGTKFRVFAQSLTLEALLQHSNRHLADFAKRYQLQRVPSSDLELQIIDKDMADDVRSVHSLSGGESFLVSLALALGLASLSSQQTQVESLFIDEGFGSLDPETLDIAIASLDSLQALGRKVALISHVPILVERIGAKVVVSKQGGGKSTVSVVAN